MNVVEKLLYLNGVSAEYFDYAGQQRFMSPDHRQDVLRALGYDLKDVAALNESVFQLDARPWMQLSKAFNITGQNDPKLTIFCSQDDLTNEINWALDAGQDKPITGLVAAADLHESGEYLIDSVRYSACDLPLGELPVGYHQLSLKMGPRSAEVVVAVCPSKCHELADTGKLWGFTCQLYTLRSDKNWGIGDFRDLRELIEVAAKCGANLIGLNPLHAPTSDGTDTPSPYSPSDRRALNPLYIDVESVPEFAACAALQAVPDSPELTALRAGPMIDYPVVSETKYAAFEAMYEQFMAPLAALQKSRVREFEAFVVEQGELLQQFCLHEVRHNGYAQRYKHDVRFFLYLQWLASRQLVECQEFALQNGMKLGLVGDLAVGAVAEGGEVLSNTDLYLPDVKIGAPPDPFSETGQNWGLSAPSPVAMRQQGYAHFIELLQANMRHVGALRIDHVMSFLRLWWCLPGDNKDARDGIYVHYPLSELMALLRLESQLNSCVAIGEDLGVVPDEIRSEMSASRLYSNKVFYFEQEFDGRFRQPGEYVREALLMVTNHDVPCLAEWWSQNDLVRRKKLGLLEGDAFDHEMDRRARDKRAMLRWLADNDALPENWKLADTGREFDFMLSESIHKICARSNALMLLIQLEDLQAEIAPVNIPGTHREYPNWRRKQTMSSKQIVMTDHAQGIISAINRERVN